jgi:uncharacterized membrane protein YhaH (DUF805 family)
MVHQSRWAIWAAMAVSLLVYLAIPLFLPAPPMAYETTDFGVLFTALGVVAVLTSVASLLLRRAVVIQPLQRGTLDPDSATGAQRLTQALVLTWALSEAVAIYGLVLYLLTRQVQLMVPFIMMSACLLVVHAPRHMEAGARR